MAKRTLATPKRKRSRKNQGAKVRVDIEQSGELSVAMYQDAIAALASVAAERVSKALQAPTKKRLKPETKDRRKRAGVHHDIPWFRTGELRRSIAVQRVGNFEDVFTPAHRLYRAQRNGILREAGLVGSQKQATFAAIEREVMDLLVADSEADARAKDARITALIRRNKKGRI